jgi:hypothetical protein
MAEKLKQRETLETLDLTLATSHYDPQANRCYVLIQQYSHDASRSYRKPDEQQSYREDKLFDAQSGERLASVLKAFSPKAEFKPVYSGFIGDTPNGGYDGYLKIQALIDRCMKEEKGLSGRTWKP